tara:strand:- start:348 stop:1568 length:1221 start_codon:yes stop_codon:yes gene_type:complete
MLRQSPFYNFLNRRIDLTFSQFESNHDLDIDYINWNEFLLPNNYGDPKQEYEAIRNRVALFDVTPMRKFEILGSEAGRFLDHLVTRPVSSAAPMQGLYVVFCNEDGSLKDDAILYKFAEDHYWLMPSDIDHRPHFADLCKQFEISELSISECTMDFAGMAIQGPLSAMLVKQLGVPDLELLKPFHVMDFKLQGTLIRVARMGFTADLGYECWMPIEFGSHFEVLLKNAIDNLGISAHGYGLTALEVCRIEGGFIVAGWDCATEIDPSPGFERTPFELGLGWLVDLEGCEFVGRDALLREKDIGGRYVKRCFIANGRSIPDEGSEVWGQVLGKTIVIGTVNCASWSWGLGKTIGNASIFREYMNLETGELKLEEMVVGVQLKKGPLINLKRNRQVPAPIPKTSTGLN